MLKLINSLALIGPLQDFLFNFFSPKKGGIQTVKSLMQIMRHSFTNGYALLNQNSFNVN